MELQLKKRNSVTELLLLPPPPPQRRAPTEKAQEGRKSLLLLLPVLTNLQKSCHTLEIEYFALLLTNFTSSNLATPNKNSAKKDEAKQIIRYTFSKFAKKTVVIMS